MFRTAARVRLGLARLISADVACSNARSSADELARLRFEREEVARFLAGYPRAS